MMRRSLLVLVLVLVALAGWAQPARAQEWCTTATLTGQLGTQTVVRSLASGSGAILAGTGPNAQIWRSLDNGASWTLIRAFDGQTDVWSLASLGNGVFLAGTVPSGQVWRSTDNGASWSLTFEYGTGLTHLDMASFGDVVLIAGRTTSLALYRSLDAGLTWSAPAVAPNPLLNGSRLFVDLGDELLFFSRALSGAFPQIWYSVDRGNTWLYRSQINAAISGFRYVSPDLYVFGGLSGTGRFFHSTDNGASWTQLSVLSGTGTGIGLIHNRFVLSSGSSFYRGDGSTWDLIATTNQTTFQSFVQIDVNTALFGSDGSAQIWRVSAALCPTPTPAPITPGPTATPLPTPIGIIEYPPNLDDQTFGDLSIGMYAVMDHVVAVSTHPTGLAILSLIFLAMFFQTLRIFLIKRSKQ